MVCDCYKFENDASYHVFPEYEYESQSVHLNEPSTNCPSITESYYDGSSAGTESNPHSLSNAVINPDPELKTSGVLSNVMGNYIQGEYKISIQIQ
jgi:hypothetical protein